MNTRARTIKNILILIFFLALISFNGVSFLRAKAENIDFIFSQNNDKKAPQISINFTLKNKTYNYTSVPLYEPDFTVKSDFHERRINASNEEKIRFVEENIRRGASVKNALLYTFPLLETTINQIIADGYVKPQDAEISFCPALNPKFIIKKEKAGLAVNESKLYYSVYSALRKNTQINLAVNQEQIQPLICSSELTKQCVLRGEFSTDFSSSTKNRKHNIKLALCKINGTKIESGKSFSFNKVVGSRSEKNGFMQAKIILDGEYADGVGGGVCQASTTVYNCALVAGMEIEKARAHSLPPSYVSPSFDAMVNSSGSDLVFKNTTSAPVYIYASGDGDRATVKIYGLENEVKIVRESKTISVSPTPEDKIVIDENNEYDTQNLNFGEKKRISYGCGSVVSEGYLCYYKNGKLVDKKLIRKDFYRSLRGTVAVKKGSEFDKTIQAD